MDQGPRATTWAIDKAYFQVELDTGDDAESYALVAYEFGNALNGWWRNALAWIELWSGQLLTQERGPGAYISGQVWTVGGQHPIKKRTGWSRGDNVVVVQSSDVVLRHQDLSAALSRASRQEQPPLEWVLYVRSQRRSDVRLSLIEAATAAEVGLSSAISTRLVQLTKEGRERIIKDANGIVGLIRLIEDIDGFSGTSWANRVMDRLAGPRNDAAHAGVTPDEDTLKAATEEARRILDRYSPMPAAESAR